MRPAPFPAALGAAASAALAPSFPGRIDTAPVGDWQCGGTRANITRLGSIEMLGEAYRSGLFDAADRVRAIRRDDGAREDWRYHPAAGGIAFTAPDGADLACTPRQ